MSHNDASIAEASYHRCAESGQFYTTFYAHLLASDPRIPPMFAHTEFERQNRLLKHALGLLIIFAKRTNPALLERIAERHQEVGVRISSLLRRKPRPSVRSMTPNTRLSWDAWRVARHRVLHQAPYRRAADRAPDHAPAQEQLQAATLGDYGSR